MVSGERALAEEYKSRSKGSMGLVLDHNAGQSYTNPPAASRDGGNPLAKEFMDRNRGSMEKFINPKHEANSRYESPRPVSRLGSGSARSIADKHRGQRGIINPEPETYITSARGRVRPEGLDNMDRNVRGSMSGILGGGNGSYRAISPDPRIKPEAQDNARKNRGIMNLVMDNDSNQRYNSPRPQSRVKREAEDMANKGKGTMSIVLDNERNQRYNTPRPNPRVKVEAGEVANKNKGTLSNIYANYGKLPIDPLPNAKVSGQAKDIAHHGTQGTAGFLFTKYGKLPQDEKPQARIKPEARRIAKVSKGSVGAIFQPKITYKKRK